MTAERETGLPVTVMVFDDGWIEHPTVLDRATVIRRNVVVVLVVVAFVSVGLTGSFALVDLLGRLDVPLALQIVAPTCLSVAVVLLGSNYLLSTGVHALLQARADRRQDRTDPAAAERRLRRKAGVPWYRRVRSAAEYASLFENPVGVAGASLAGIAYRPQGPNHRVTVWLKDGAVRSYRSTDVRLAQQLARFATLPVPGLVGRPPAAGWPLPRRRVWPVVVVGLVIVAGIVAFPVTLSLMTAIQTHDSRTLTSAPDTAGPVRGAAQRLTAALRAQGYSCSDEGIDPGLVSRICGRTTPDHRAYVEFVGSAATGELQRVKVFIVPSDQPPAAVPDTVSAVADGLGMNADEKTTFLAGVSTDQGGTFRVGRWTYEQISQGNLDVRLTGWSVPYEKAATLGGPAEEVLRVATSLGYECTRDEWSVSCTRRSGNVEYTLEARETVEHSELTRLYLFVSSKRDSQQRWLQEMTTLLERLPGSRAATVDAWLRANPQVGGADAYVAGMRVYLRTYRGDRMSSGDLLSTCWPQRSDPFC